MKKILEVEVTKKSNTTYAYDYMYKDNKGVVVRGEALPSIEFIEKLIKKRMNKLSNEDYKIILK